MRRQRAFSLAELMLSFLLVSLAALFVLALYTAGMRDYAHTETAARAFHLAQARLEVLMSCPMGDVQAGNWGLGAPDEEFSYQVDTAPRPGFAGSLDVAVTVTHGPSGIARRLDGLRAPSHTPEGYRIFTGHVCHTCHHLSDSDFDRSDFGTTGPRLGRMTGTDGALASYQLIYASDTYLNSGSLTPEQFFRDSVRDPNRFAPDPYRNPYNDNKTLMEGDFNSPSHEEYLSSQELNGLYTWLNTLPPGHSGP